MNKKDVTSKKPQRAIDRLRDFVFHLKLEKRITGDFQFETICGLSNKYLSNSSQPGRPGTIGSDVIARVHTVFPELNITWLCTGEGDMLNAVRVYGNEAYSDIEKMEKMIREMGILIRKVKNATNL